MFKTPTLRAARRWALAVGFAAVLGLSACGPDYDPKTDVVLHTDFGPVEIMLYDDTPKHKANFLKLAREGYYDSTQFHRIIKDFMIQGGDPDSKGAGMDKPLGAGGPKYTIPAEINPKRFHKRGALAAARDENPNMESSGSQFYIVQGRKLTEQDITAMEYELTERRYQSQMRKYFSEVFMKKPKYEWLSKIEYARLQQEKPDSLALLNKQVGEWVDKEMKADNVQIDTTIYKIPEEHKRTYLTLGGAPHLDNSYTVFGEVVKGMAIVDSIAKQPTVQGNPMLQDRPGKPILIQRAEVVEK